jgi:hypothetical protein
MDNSANDKQLEQYGAIITAWVLGSYENELSLRLSNLDLGANTDGAIKIYLRNEFKQIIMNILNICGMRLNRVYCPSSEKYTQNKLFNEIMTKVSVDYLYFTIKFDTEIETKEAREQFCSDYGENFEKGTVTKCLNIIGSISKLSALEISFVYPIKYVKNSIQMFIDFLEQKDISNVILHIDCIKENNVKQYLDISDKWKTAGSDNELHLFLLHE